MQGPIVAFSELSAHMGMHPAAVVQAWWYVLQNGRSYQACAPQQVYQQGPSQALQAEVATFAADRRSNPHFGIPQSDMLHLLENNRASSLREAYDLAEKIHPATRAEAAHSGARVR
jgi:hypothetical protein